MTYSKNKTKQYLVYLLGRIRTKLDIFSFFASFFAYSYTVVNTLTTQYALTVHSVFSS